MNFKIKLPENIKIRPLIIQKNHNNISPENKSKKRYYYFGFFIKEDIHIIRRLNLEDPLKNYICTKCSMANEFDLNIYNIIIEPFRQYTYSVQKILDEYIKYGNKISTNKFNKNVCLYSKTFEIKSNLGIYRYTFITRKNSEFVIKEFIDQNGKISNISTTCQSVLLCSNDAVKYIIFNILNLYNILEYYVTGINNEYKDSSSHNRRISFLNDTINIISSFKYVTNTLCHIDSIDNIIKDINDQTIKLVDCLKDYLDKSSNDPNSCNSHIRSFNSYNCKLAVKKDIYKYLKGPYSTFVNKYLNDNKTIHISTVNTKTYGIFVNLYTLDICDKFNFLRLYKENGIENITNTFFGNTDSNGEICWGNIQRAEELIYNNIIRLDEAFNIYINSEFSLENSDYILYRYNEMSGNTYINTFLEEVDNIGLKDKRNNTERKYKIVYELDTNIRTYDLNIDKNSITLKSGNIVINLD